MRHWTDYLLAALIFCVLIPMVIAALVLSVVDDLKRQLRRDGRQERGR